MGAMIQAAPDEATREEWRRLAAQAPDAGQASTAPAEAGRLEESAPADGSPDPDDQAAPVQSGQGARTREEAREAVRTLLVEGLTGSGDRAAHQGVAVDRRCGAEGSGSLIARIATVKHPRHVQGSARSDMPAPHMPPDLEALADRLRRLSPSRRDPETYHVEKDDIERTLRRLARHYR